MHTHGAAAASLGTHRRVCPPPPQHVVQVQVGLQLGRDAVPDPVVALLLVALVVVQQLAVDVRQGVAVAVALALDAVVVVRAGPGQQLGVILLLRCSLDGPAVSLPLSFPPSCSITNRDIPTKGENPGSRENPDEEQTQAKKTLTQAKGP